MVFINSASSLGGCRGRLIGRVRGYQPEYFLGKYKEAMKQTSSDGDPWRATRLCLLGQDTLVKRLQVTNIKCRDVAPKRRRGSNLTCYGRSIVLERSCLSVLATFTVTRLGLLHPPPTREKYGIYARPV